jgi:hypothetical protein
MNAEFDNPLNAYQPPAPGADESQQKQPGAGRVKAICIVAIVLGCLGVFSALGGMVGLLFGQQIQGAMSTPNQPGMPPEMVQAQRDMERDLYAIQNRFLPINAVLIALLVLVSAGLLIGGIQSLRRVTPGRKVLVAACSAAIVFELLRGIVQVVIQAQTISMTMQHTERMLDAGGGPPGMAEMAMTVARVAIIVGIVFGVLWMLAKLVFYGISVWYLRKPSVVAYLDGPASNPFSAQETSYE